MSIRSSPSSPQGRVTTAAPSRSRPSTCARVSRGRLPRHGARRLRVRGQPFSPHPHAGFSAVTYVFEDSEGSLEAATRSATTSSSVQAESSGHRPEAA